MNLTEVLKNKRILFLSVQTFNYEVFISEQLRKFGAIVDYYDERPKNSLFAKGIIRLKRSLYQRKIDNYYNGILAISKTAKYDYLLVLRGEVVPEFFLRELRKHQRSCVFIFYTWDSFANHSHPLTIQQYFDKRFTFDNNDASKYGLSFRPLFFLNEYDQISSKKTNFFEFNLLFLGTAHSDRYRISNEIINWCKANNFNAFAYYYMHGRMVFFYKKLFDKSFKKFQYSKLSFKSLEIKKILDLYQKSQVILDINHPGQNGLTMRTFEALGAGRKLITTNEEIVKYPFYNANNIFVIDRVTPKIDKIFFDSSFEPINPNILENMSIDGWLKSLFVDNSPNYWLPNIN